jgi:hypothetical protein
VHAAETCNAEVLEPALSLAPLISRSAEAANMRLSIVLSLVIATMAVSIYDAYLLLSSMAN